MKKCSTDSETERPEARGTFLTNTCESLINKFIQINIKHRERRLSLSSELTVNCSGHLGCEAKNRSLIDATLPYSLNSMKQVQNVNKYSAPMWTKNLLSKTTTHSLDSVHRIRFKNYPEGHENEQQKVKEDYTSYDCKHLIRCSI